MRVHRLRVEAFGPFPGVVDLDLDALAAEGLFLIHGPTGAGKTSLLDAICYALYADVPGARSKKGLRSDHAPEGAAPEVTLEFTAGHRRLRIVRSPEFSRTKKRGTGQLAVNARVTLEERLGSEWVPRGTRNDEVADLIRDVLGMGMAQFASVVLLPQGDFATFLRASPEDRRAVLERLFDITDYRDVEDWLAKARRDARADLEQARSVLAAELTRVEDVIVEAGLGVEAPAAPALGALDSAPGAADADAGASGGLSALPPEDVSHHLSVLLSRIDAAVSSTMTAYDDAASAEGRAAAALERVRVLADVRARGEHAEHLTAAASTAPALTLRLETARASLRRFDAAETARAAAASLVPVRDGARTISLDRRQDLLDLRARRLDQMAGELAASLSAGAPCPVCGSADHPEIASTTDPVGPEDLVEAESRLEEAEQAHRSLHDEVQAHLHRAATLQATLDATDRAVLEASVLQLTRALDAAHESVAERDAMVARALAHSEQTDAMRRQAASVMAQRASVAELLTGIEADQGADLERLGAISVSTPRTNDPTSVNRSTPPLP